MFGLILVFATGIIATGCDLHKAFSTGKKRDEAHKWGDDEYIDDWGKNRITETNRYGGTLLKMYKRGEELKKLNDELCYIEENDRILVDFTTGKELKNYSREQRIKDINKALQNAQEKSAITYLPYKHNPHNSCDDICKGYRYMDVKTHDLYVIRRGKYGEYYLRIADGKFIRPIDHREVTRWKKTQATQAQLKEINDLNSEQEIIKHSYQGKEKFDRLYRNNDHVGIKTLIDNY